MRTYFDKNKLLTGIVILLLVLNISILATFLFRNNRNRNIPVRNVPTQSMIPDRQGIFLRNELRLDENQFIRFQDIRENYQKKASGIEREIQGKKTLLTNEMVKSEPDSVRIRKIGDEIGQLNSKLLAETSLYYFEIRNLCNDEQKIRLDSFFSRIVRGEEYNMSRERRLPFRTGRNNSNNRSNNRN